MQLWVTQITHANRQEYSHLPVLIYALLNSTVVRELESGELKNSCLTIYKGNDDIDDHDHYHHDADDDDVEEEEELRDTSQ